jgi:hypothetical protein
MPFNGFRLFSSPFHIRKQPGKLSGMLREGYAGLPSYSSPFSIQPDPEEEAMQISHFNEYIGFAYL